MNNNEIDRTCTHDILKSYNKFNKNKQKKLIDIKLFSLLSKYIEKKYFYNKSYQNLLINYYFNLNDDDKKKYIDNLINSECDINIKLFKYMDFFDNIFTIKVNEDEMNEIFLMNKNLSNSFKIDKINLMIELFLE